MSWNTITVAVKNYKGTDGELLEALCLPSDGEPQVVSFDGAGSSMLEGAAIGRVSNLHVVFCPIFWLPSMMDESTGEPSEELDAFAKSIAQASAGTEMIAVVTLGASCTAGFAYWKDGSLVRESIYQEDRVWVDNGTPLPTESDYAQEDCRDDFAFGMAADLGFDLFADMSQTFSLYAFPEDDC